MGSKSQRPLACSTYETTIWERNSLNCYILILFGGLKWLLVIIQDVRGQGSSEGKFQGFKQEANDTSETHEWVRSLKECNGKLGLYGFSYQGLTQLTGTEDSEPPDCLSPAMMGLDFKNHWSSDGGAYWWDNNISWALQMAALKMKRENNYSGWEDIKLSIENKSYLRTSLELIENMILIIS